MKKQLMTAFVVVSLLIGIAGFANAAPYVVNGALAGPTDGLADVRFRNFQTAVSGEYEMMIGNSFDTNGSTIINSGTITTGHVPNFAYNQAAWATNNDFWITYDPLANAGAGWVSLRLMGSGAQAGGATGGYDVTIGRAPDAVANPVNYINFQLWDRVNFPTFNNGLTLSSLDGTNLGTFTIPALGIGSWSILDPGGATLNNGFILQGDFTLDLTKVAEGKEGDKIIFGIGSNPNVPVPEPTTLMLLGFGLIGVAVAGRKR